MGGRGGASGFSATGGNIATTVLDSTGAKIDLSANPLTYGNNDTALSGAARAAIEAFENKRYKNKIEFSLLTDAAGNTIEENRGSKGQVRSSVAVHRIAAILTHNHPRANSVIGGTFSTADLNNFVAYNQTTYRATASEGAYSISKLKGMNKTGFVVYYNKEFTVNRKAYESRAASADAKYKAGGYASYSEYEQEYHAASNQYLVANHNSLIAGQKKYGYSYTLERRTK